MNDTSLAIVGASVRAAAMSALRAGYLPIVADIFADADLQALCPAVRVSSYPRGLAEWLANAPASNWMFTGALENYPSLVEDMSRQKPLAGNGADVLHRIRSPLVLQKILSDALLRFPETRTDTADVPLDGSWLAKTYRGSSGSGVFSFEPSLCTTIEKAQNDFSKIVLQRRIDGDAGAAIFIAAYGNSQLLGITKQIIDAKWTHAKPFQYAGSMGPWAIGDNAVDQLQRIGDMLARDFDLVGLFGVDFVLSDSVVWTIEVNPRYTASVEVVERMCDINTISLHMEACSGNGNCAFGHLAYNPRLATVHGKAILFARGEVVVSPAFSSWMMEANHHPLQPVIADIPAANTRISLGRPVATVFATEDSETATATRLKENLVALEEKLYAG